MRVKKTRQSDRGVYRYPVQVEDGRGGYRTAYNVIKPGEDGITEVMIKSLHAMDDHEVYLNVKNGHGGVTVPSKPKKPCAYPGCPALVTGRYCEEHARKANSDYEKFSRDKNTKRRYGRAWKRIRDKYAAEHPFCEKCYEHGVLVPVEEIHHKLPLSEGGTHDRGNLIALCKSCHSQIHAKRGDRWHDR